MTTDAIEAGARAILERTKITQQSDAIGLATLVIEAAIASGELVPASAVAAEREAIARVIDPEAFQNGLRKDGVSVYWFERRAAALAKADLIRSLSPAPASGEYVVVPREPTEAMIYAMHHQIDWCRDGQNTYYLEHPSQNPKGVGTSCKDDIRDAYRAMLNAATKDGKQP